MKAIDCTKNKKLKSKPRTKIRDQIISEILKRVIPAKTKSKGRITKFNELLRELFHFEDAERTSFIERKPISPMTAETPY